MVKMDTGAGKILFGVAITAVVTAAVALIIVTAGEAIWQGLQTLFG